MTCPEEDRETVPPTASNVSARIIRSPSTSLASIRSAAMTRT
jgi:hypothetical protein